MLEGLVFGSICGQTVKTFSVNDEITERRTWSDGERLVVETWSPEGIHIKTSYTDETPTNGELVATVSSEIYVWEGTLTAGSIPPYEGANVLSWQTAGLGWFVGRIRTDARLRRVHPFVAVGLFGSLTTFSVTEEGSTNRPSTCTTCRSGSSGNPTATLVAA